MLRDDHKKEILTVLDESLRSSSHDFRQYFINDDDSCNYFPSTWNIKNTKKFSFVHIKSCLEKGITHPERLIF